MGIVSATADAECRSVGYYVRLSTISEWLDGVVKENAPNWRGVGGGSATKKPAADARPKRTTTSVKRVNQPAATRTA